MKNKIKAIIKISKHELLRKHKLIKVRLDYKTYITLWRMSSLKVWRKRYPDAKVMTV